MKKLFERMKSYSFWISFSGALVIFINCIGRIFNFQIDNKIVEDVVMSIAGLLVVLGFITKETKNSATSNENDENFENKNLEDKSLNINKLDIGLNDNNLNDTNLDDKSLGNENLEDKGSNNKNLNVANLEDESLNANLNDTNFDDKNLSNENLKEEKLKAEKRLDNERTSSNSQDGLVSYAQDDMDNKTLVDKDN